MEVEEFAELFFTDTSIAGLEIKICRILIHFEKTRGLHVAVHTQVAGMSSHAINNFSSSSRQQLFNNRFFPR